MVKDRGWDLFINGMCCTVFLYGLLQDYLGLEAYIKFARDMWIDMPWGIWVLALILVVYVERSRQARARKT